MLKYRFHKYLHEKYKFVTTKSYFRKKPWFFNLYKLSFFRFRKTLFISHYNETTDTYSIVIDVTSTYNWDFFKFAKNKFQM